VPYNENSEFPQILYSTANLTGAVPVVLSTTGIKISGFWAKGGPGGVLTFQRPGGGAIYFEHKLGSFSTIYCPRGFHAADGLEIHTPVSGLAVVIWSLEI
jgi:hypothetical protein